MGEHCSLSNHIQQFVALGIILGGICLSASRAKANGCVRLCNAAFKSRATQHGLEMGVNLWEIYTSLHALAHNTARFLLPFLNLIYSKSNLWTQFIIPSSRCFSNVSKIQYFTFSFSVMKIITVGLKRKLSASENHIKEENCAYDK